MNKLLIGTRKGLFTASRDGVGAWSLRAPDFLGDHVSFAMVDRRTGRAFAALKHGHFGVKLHRAVSLGAAWEEVTAPKYPPFPEGREPDRCPMRGIEIPWNLEMIWTLVPGNPDQPGRLWAGTIPGRLFRSDDEGASWTLVESLWNRPERVQMMGGGYDYPGIHSVCVDPRNSKAISVAISCGGVWCSEDDGVTWSLEGRGLRSEYAPPEIEDQRILQDPHLMAACPASPKALWIQHHNGIFRSADGGRSFSEIAEAGPSVFGFAVAVHPKDPQTAWFVPAIKDEQRTPVDGALVVTRTRDGGASFETLRRGLPQEHAYDLVFRHGLAIDDTGERLAFGSTTGGLYVTEDGGDSWTVVSSNLPPIHSVVFCESGGA